MLKGDVFAEQLFENQIFALFIDTFLNGNCGVASNYKNSMALTYSGGNVTIDSGAVCIKGRFLEESTSTTLAVGEANKFHSLVIEIDLDKTNTASSFEQGYYKILSAPYSYPDLTQTDIVKNVSGVYQYELARFKTNGSGNITDFSDRRTFLDMESIYDAIESAATTLLNNLNTEATNLINDLAEELQEARDGSLYLTKNDLYYALGDTYKPAPQTFNAYVTDDRETIRICIKTPKSMKFVKNYALDISSLKLTMRGTNGYITTTLGQDVLSNLTYAQITDDDTIMLTLQKLGGWNNATNNTPIAASVNSANDVVIRFYDPMP